MSSCLNVSVASHLNSQPPHPMKCGWFGDQMENGCVLSGSIQFGSLLLLLSRVLPC